MVTRVQLPIIYRVASSSEDSIALAIWTFIQCGLKFLPHFSHFLQGAVLALLLIIVSLRAPGTVKLVSPGELVKIVSPKVYVEVVFVPKVPVVPKIVRVNLVVWVDANSPFVFDSSISF